MVTHSPGKGRCKITSVKDSNAQDEVLFKKTMAGVKPLNNKHPLSTKNTRVSKTPLLTSGHSKDSFTGLFNSTSLMAKNNQQQPRLHVDKFAGVDRRTVERLRRGKLPIEARLDLHGYYQDIAQSELNAFINRCALSGRRTVLVITGKGSLSKGGGVLRRNLPDWLNHPSCRPYILAFCEARPEHGGAGAFYILLRRSNKENM